MTMESNVFDALKGLVSNRVYPDVAPIGAAKPYITYQKVGGQAINYLETAHPGARHARVQLNVWGTTRLEVAALARSAEEALVNSTTLRAYVYGGVVDLHEEDLSPPLYGTRQDFGIRY